MLKLNYSSSRRPSWLNILPDPKADLPWQFENGIPFPEGCAEAIYVKKELTDSQRFVMSEVWRVLKDGGSFEFEFRVPQHKEVWDWSADSILRFCDDNQRKLWMLYPKFEVKSLTQVEKKGMSILSGKLIAMKKGSILEKIRKAMLVNPVVVRSDEEGIAGELGVLDIASGAKGAGVLQLHLTGLSEKELKKLMFQAKNLKKESKKGLEQAIKILPDIDYHLDFRLQPKETDYWEGGVIALGDPVTILFKQPVNIFRKAAYIFRGSLGWMQAGKKLERVSGDELMLLVDTFSWKALTQMKEEKLFKVRMDINKSFSGAWNLKKKKECWEVVGYV